MKTAKRKSALKRRATPLGDAELMASIAKVAALPLPKGFIPLRNLKKPKANPRPQLKAMTKEEHTLRRSEQHRSNWPQDYRD